MDPFRRPTSIPLDPGPSSAAVVVTNFVPKSFANEARTIGPTRQGEFWKTNVPGTAVFDIPNVGGGRSGQAL